MVDKLNELIALNPRKEIGSRERIRTSTGGVLNAVPLLLGYATIMASAAGVAAPAATQYGSAFYRKVLSRNAFAPTTPRF